MAEEFQESEVIFGECVEDEECNFPLSSRPESGNYNSKLGKRKKLKVNNKKSAVPVSIPENVPRNAWFSYMESDIDGGDDGEMVPPHVIIGRRVAGKMMAFSLCTGKGRTLKGRDLSEVRNSILRMTGFLET